MSVTVSLKMKDSGVKWIGAIPHHWQVRKLKHWVRFLNHRRIPISSENRAELTKEYPYYGASGIIDYVNDYIFDQPHILIAEDGANLLSRSSPLAFLATGKYWVNNHAHILKPISGNLSYWVARLETISYVPFVTGSAQPKLTIENLASIEFAAPSPEEQDRIGVYLDRKTAQIDTLIAKKQRLIELLQEKRQALISRAVTKGLNPNVPMKDSGVEWLGMIPKHWTLERLKFRSPHVTVGIVVTPAKFYVDGGVPCLRSLNVRPFLIRDSDLVFMSEESNRLHGKSIIRRGDLVAVRTGQPGSTAVIDERFDGANCIDLILIRHSPLFSSEFLCYFMNSNAAHVQYGSGSGGAIQQHFNIETASNLLVAWPTMDEQMTIAAKLRHECVRLCELEEANRKQITKLQEYRQTLISAAVTGKIDVRKEAHP